MNIEKIYLEEALNTVTNWLAEDLYYEPPYFVEEEIKVIKTALEKQIPRKINNYKKQPNARYGDCPICGRRVIKENYCPRCGQALDWSKE